MSAKSQALIIRPTAQGWVMVVMAAIAISALFWPGRPLLFGLGIAILVAIVYSFWAVSRRLTQVRARWLDPGPIHAGDDIALGATVEARRNLGPITLGAWDPLLERLGYVTDLPGVSTTATRVVWPGRFPRRGIFELQPLVLRNEQPFGVLFAQCSSGERLRVVVRPALGQVIKSLTEQLRRWVDEGGLSPDPGDDDISHLRNYRPGDSMRRINWRASARARHLLVTQRQAPSSQHLAIVLDTRCKHQRSKRFERLVAATATLIDHLIADGWQVSLHGIFSPAGLRGDRDHLLDALAEVKADYQQTDIAALIPRGEACLVLSLDDPGPLPHNTHTMVLNLNQLTESIRLPRIEA